ncbi:tetratricopeptide repeat protein [Desulfobacterota bacterium M19]
MSKLLDTLEKISKNEEVSRQSGGGDALSTGDASRRTSVKSVTVMAFIIIVLSIYGGWPYLTEHLDKINPKNSSHGIKIVRTPQKRQLKVGLHTVSKTIQVRKRQILVNKNTEAFVRFNQLAIQYIHKNQPWKGIYYFQKAVAAAPNRIEPLVNVAVVYTELGYYPKALKLFEKAYRINPDFPPLLKNLKILYRADLLKDSLLYKKFKKTYIRKKSKSKL